jgi:hypothetical protein
MPRDMSVAAAAQVIAPVTRMGVFVSAQFITGTIYVWSGYGAVTTPSGLAMPAETWLGLGSLGTISVISEDSSLTAQGITIGLSGIDANVLSKCLGEVQQGLPVNVYLVFFDENNQPIDGILCYSGRMDQPSFEEGVDKCSITIACENRLSDLQRSSQRRYTDQDQKLRYPNDNGLRLIALAQDWNGTWGQGNSWSAGPYLAALTNSGY